MYSENGVMIDFAEIGKVIDTADVFVVGFMNIPERLIVDTRWNDVETPMVQVVQPSTGARQRLAWLKRRRPSLGDPDSFIFMPWPHSAGFLEETGIWQQIVTRVAGDVDAPVKDQCDAAMLKLKSLERAATLAILRGDNAMTLWPREEE